jgi:hypothetical protein
MCTCDVLAKLRVIHLVIDPDAVGSVG